MGNQEIEEWKENFSERILFLLEKNNMTQRELAKAMGITEVTVSRYINKQRVPKATTILDMSRVLMCPCSWLIRFDDIAPSQHIKKGAQE